MAEFSRPWPGVTVGDAGPYTASQWDDIWGILHGAGYQALLYNRGVVRNFWNELEVTDGGANQADVAEGAGLVRGKFYYNNAPVNVVVPSSVGAWREDLICLRSDWTLQTVRIYRHANPADGVGYPAPTQTDGVAWEIPLAAVRINAAGAITLITDLRDYVSTLLQRKQLQISPQPRVLGTALWADNSCGGAGGDHAVVDLIANNDGAIFEFVVPFDFISLRSAVVYYIPNGTGTWDYRVGSGFGGCGENRCAGLDTFNAAAVPVTTVIVTCMDVLAALDGIAAGDLVGLLVERMGVGGATTSLQIAKLVIEYA